MKKLSHAIIWIAVILFSLRFIPKISGFDFNFWIIAHSAADTIGSAATIAGLYKIIGAVFFKTDKAAFYQGAFCIFLGMSIASFSMWPFVPAVALIAWLDHKGQSII